MSQDTTDTPATSTARNLRRSLASVLRIGCGVYVGLCLVLYLGQDSLIFHPRALSDGLRRVARATPGVAEIDMTTRDGSRLHGWIRHTDDARPAPLVIYFGGNAEEVSGQILNASRLAPWSLVAINYRGYGLSEGSPGEAELFADALQAFDALAARQDVDADRIVAFGRSLGTGVAVQLAANRPLQGIVLVSPYDSLLSLARVRYPFVPVSWMLEHRFDSLSRAPDIKTPVLMLAAQRDALISPPHSRRLFEAWAGPKRWVEIPAAGHNDISSGEGYWSAIIAFLGSLGG